jgi:DNA ligase-1
VRKSDVEAEKTTEPESAPEPSVEPVAEPMAEPQPVADPVAEPKTAAEVEIDTSAILARTTPSAPEPVVLFAPSTKPKDDEDEEYAVSDGDGDVSDDSEDDDIEDEEEGPPADGLAKVMKAANKRTEVKSKKKTLKSAKSEKPDQNGVGDRAVEAAGRLLSYDPEIAADWAGKPAPYVYLANVFENISETTKRLEISEMLTNAFRTILAASSNDGEATKHDDLLAAVYLASNSIAPQHEGVDLGVGDATLIKALAEATGRKETAIKAEYRNEGDLGIVAMMSRSTQKTMFAPPKLTIAGVLSEFRAIATAEGSKSVDLKKSKIKKLLVSARECEAGYIVRSLQGKLRIGLAQQTVTCALAHAVVLHSPAAAEAKAKGGDVAVADLLGKAFDTLKRVFSECPSFDEIVPALLMEGGIDKLGERCHFRPGVPVKPMLAKPTNGVREVLHRFADVEFTCEYKYDGERAQIHLLQDGTVKIFSRNQEDNTPKFPDVIRKLPGYLKPGTKSVVIDAEAVAFDRETNKILPFQILSTRGRKNIDEKDIKVNVAVYAFDCLFLNGVNLLREPLTKRREALYGAFQEVPGEFSFVTAKISRDLDELQVFLEDSIAENTEGLIVKTMDATYEPSKRSLNWLKLKKDYMEGCGDSLDLVPIGGFYGRGKRTGVYGAYLLACYDENTEELQSICKIGTGFSDAQLNELSEQLRPTVIDHPRSYFKYGESVKPDVWFDPKFVWEVKAADLSVSPTHQAAHGLVDPQKGIALRFPRFLRIREDKTPETATNAEQVADFYNAQATKQEFNGDDDEF